MQQICTEIVRRAGGWDTFATEIPRRLRQAMDEVIDTPRTGRFVFSQLEKTEKTYVGTKVEILLRDLLGLPKGLLDLKLAGLDVDVKNTVGSTWMIPTEAVGHPCILVQENETTAQCGIGLLVCNPRYLTTGLNKDSKASVSTVGKGNIHWILKDHPYPKNFWEDVPPNVRLQIVAPNGGTDRLFRLFMQFPRKPISRQVAEAVARQKDFMKRLRGNGGVRDRLEPLGIVLLSGMYDRDLGRAFGIVNLAEDEFVACPVTTPSQLQAVRATGRHTGVTTLAR